MLEIQSSTAKAASIDESVPMEVIEFLLAHLRAWRVVGVTPLFSCA